MALAAVALTLATAFVGFACWFGYQLLKQNGRILSQLEALQAALERPPAPSLAKSRIKRDGLAQGTRAPDFRVPGLHGGEVALADYRGRRLVLVFSDPQCGPCQLLAPQLERAYRGAGAEVVMISRGDPEANREEAARNRLTFPIGLQEHWEVSRQYAMFATPIGYLIDEDGIVAAPVAAGPDSILALLDRASSRETTAAHVSSRSVS